LKTIGKREKLLVDVVLFLIKFSLFSIPIYIIKFLNLNLLPLQQIHAFILAYLLNLVSIKSQVFYTLSPETLAEIPAIHLENFNLSFAIDNSCTGYIAMLALTGLIFSTPRKKFKQRVLFLIGGLLILFVINVLRIFLTILFALNFGEEYLDIVHGLLWREFLLIVVILLWIVFLKRSK